MTGLSSTIDSFYAANRRVKQAGAGFLSVY